MFGSFSLCFLLVCLFVFFFFFFVFFFFAYCTCFFLFSVSLFLSFRSFFLSFFLSSLTLCVSFFLSFFSLSQVNRKGALTGGYVEPHGKLQAQSAVNTAKTDIISLDDELARVQREVCVHVHVHVHVCLCVCGFVWTGVCGFVCMCVSQAQSAVNTAKTDIIALDDELARVQRELCLCVSACVYECVCLSV
jgi:hypothetical protein